MTRTKIYGAGSIGNHLAQAARRAGWDVAVVDPEESALRRMREEIYPNRYGAWDESIKLYLLGEEPKGGFEVIMLGTPPHVRMSLASLALDEDPKVLLLEKPLCPPSLEGVPEFQKKLEKSRTAVVVGYDHVVSSVVRKAEEILANGAFGKPQALDVEFRQNWQGIFAAHPWLSGPEDTYLGFWRKGGGASGEHSHATNLWQHFARFLGLGAIRQVSAAMQMVKNDKVDYDQSCFLNFVTENGFVGRVAQDVITKPDRKWLRIQCEGGFVEILINGWDKGDLLRFAPSGQSLNELKIEKTRPDDFYEEILHIQEILAGKIKVADSPLAFERGLDTMKVIKAAHVSREEGRAVTI